MRELENTIERAVVLTTDSTITRDAVTVEAAPNARTAGLPSLKLRQNVEWVECETIRRALEVSSVKRRAATLMGISPRALSHYLAKYPFIDGGRAQGAHLSGVARVRRGSGARTLPPLEPQDALPSVLLSDARTA